MVVLVQLLIVFLHLFYFYHNNLKLYFTNRGKLKVLLGIGYGKSRTDKRETIKQREWDKSKARILKGK